MIYNFDNPHEKREAAKMLEHEDVQGIFKNRIVCINQHSGDDGFHYWIYDPMDFVDGNELHSEDGGVWTSEDAADAIKLALSSID